MSIPGSSSPLFFQTAAGGAAVTGPTKSLRFNEPDSSYLDKTFSSAGDRKKWTFSAWIKRAEDSGTNFLLVAGSSDAHAIYMNGVGGSATLVVSRYISGFDYYIETTAVFRDPSAWYHVVVAYDTSASTASQRVTISVNGQTQTQFGTANYPPQNAEYEIGNNVNHRIGRYMDGYMTDVHFVNGYHRAAEDFGEYDSNSLWVHKEYDGPYGSNGFHLLDFANESTVGHDSSGNDNDFTVNNITSSGAGTDVLFDVPVNGTQSDTGAGGEVSGNYCTLNPLTAYNFSLTQGNLTGASTGSAGGGVAATMGVSSGKWYWELSPTSLGSTFMYVGVFSGDKLSDPNGTIDYPSSSSAGSNSFGFRANGSKRSNGSETSYGNSWGVGDVVGIAVDMDNGKIWFSVNGTFQASGNPAAGTNAAYTTLSGTVVPGIGDADAAANATFDMNFGARSFAYSAPSGFKALCTTNLPAPTIADPTNHFLVKLWQGDGSTGESIRGFKFVPDIMWHKVRSLSSTDHYLFDSVRDASSQFKKYLQPNTRDNASAVDGALEYFWNVTNNSGYQMANGASGAAGVKAFDTNGENYVGWTWDAGTTTSSNTNGSITSQVRASTTTGTSIVTYDGTGANGTVGHGLGAPPEMIIFKDINRDNEPWFVYHSALGNQANLFLNTNAAATTGQSDFMNSTSPTSTVFSVGNATGKQNRNGSNFIAYCFAPIDQYSAIGEYTGNGNTSGGGPFVFTGFRPAFIMIKANNGGEDAHWAIFDNKRLERNGDGQNPILYPNRDVDEFTGNEYRIDILSNGFKIKVNFASGINFGGTKHVYYAVAQHPFQTNGGLAR
tara:strand:+ start:369 stop:2867 length:2499 start_codon:yes stop_codon:yes gene_type:complete